MVQGGYNAALAAEDSIERHFMDTIEGGAWLSDQDLAWTLVSSAVERVRELENELGVCSIAMLMARSIRKHLPDRLLTARCTRAT